MGQVTLPVLNRKGIYDVWNTSWQAQQSFSTNFLEDRFLSNFFRKFFINWISKYHVYGYRKKRRTSTNYRHHRYISYNNQLDLKEFVKYLSQSVSKKFPYYISRLYLIKYNKWIVLYMYVYVPAAWYRRFSKKKKKLYNYKYILDLYKYHFFKTNFGKNQY